MTRQRSSLATTAAGSATEMANKASQSATQGMMSSGVLASTSIGFRWYWWQRLVSYALGGNKLALSLTTRKSRRPLQSFMQASQMPQSNCDKMSGPDSLTQIIFSDRAPNVPPGPS